MRTNRWYLVGVALAASACGPPALSVTWTALEDINANTAPTVRVYEGIDSAFPLRAWYARISPGDDAQVRIHQSDDTSDNRETVESFATDEGACVAVNGGYFTMDEDPAAHGGLLVERGRVRWGATRSVTRSSVAYPTARAAIGVFPDGGVDIAWVTSSGDSVLAWDRPIANVPGTPGELPDPPPTSRWNVEQALAAGPLLIKDGQVTITSDEEVFFGSSIPDVHPRTAAGVTAEGDLLLLVVDGRQPISRGVDLNELATVLLGIGAVQALNLDGGGSSTFVAGGEVLNKPAGETDLREVMSAITVRCGRP
ncbi:MAG: hypothetical protein ACI9OJ_004328 [Myxococcota bacterium]|jgi:hypothetical protein